MLMDDDAVMADEEGCRPQFDVAVIVGRRYRFNRDRLQSDTATSLTPTS